jgi:hypothetical protein
VDPGVVAQGTTDLAPSLAGAVAQADALRLRSPGGQGSEFDVTAGVATNDGSDVSLNQVDDSVVGCFCCLPDVNDAGGRFASISS